MKPRLCSPKAVAVFANGFAHKLQILRGELAVRLLLQLLQVVVHIDVSLQASLQLLLGQLERIRQSLDVFNRNLVFFFHWFADESCVLESILNGFHFLNLFLG